MARYILRRIGAGLLCVFLLSSLVFLVLRATGDPASIIMPFEAGPEEIAAFRRALLLDRPLSEQYLHFITRLARLDAGISFRYKEPTMPLVLSRMPATLELSFSALVIALLASVPLGILAATRRNSALDALVSLCSYVGYSTPVFWLGMELMILFSVRLRVLPTSGRGGWQHLLLPAVTLAVWPLAQFTRLVRSEMLEVLRQDYIRTARAKGVPERSVHLKHALRNAAGPLVSLIGLNVGILLGGTILVENVFSWPGVGRLAIQGVLLRDFPVVQACVIVMGTGVAIVTLLADLGYRLLDPRVRL